MVKINCKGFWTKSTLLGLGLGQLLSLLVTLIGFTSSQLAKQGVNAPFSQCLLSYLLLALVYGGICMCRPLEKKSICHIFRDVMLTYVDAYAKYFVIMAFQYTSLTSVMLLDCWTIPCVMLLAWVFLKAKLGLQNLVGIAICVAGLATVVWSDVHLGDRSSGSNPLMGDVAIIIGATLYGISNICEESFLKKADRVELLALIGYHGAILCALNINDDERNEFKSILSSPEAIIYVIGFSLAIFLFYSGVPLLLKFGGSKMLSLSLLTSNVWAVLIQKFAYHEKVDCCYYLLAFAAVTLGLIIYLGGDGVDPDNGEAAPIDEEAGLRHLENVEISNNDGSRILFKGARNSLCYIMHNES